MDTLNCLKRLKKNDNQQKLLMYKVIDLENDDNVNKKLSDYDIFLLENKILLDNINVLINCNNLEDLLLYNNQLFINDKYFKTVYNYFYKDIYKNLFFIESLYSKLYQITINNIKNKEINQRNMILNHIKNLLFNSKFFFEKIITLLNENIIIDKIDKLIIDLINNISYLDGILNKNILI